MAGPKADLIPRDEDTVVVRLGARETTLTNLRKPFWPELGLTKGDLLRYYLEVADVLVPHVRDRAMVMKRYPNGAAGPFFFMKRTPSPRPPWLETCRIEHRSGNVIDFPMVQDPLALLWIINLGCIDLNPWYARCDDTDRPDFLHFDLDPTPGATLAHIVEAARHVRAALTELGMSSCVKTTGSRGLHVYVAIERGPTQKQVWTFAKALALELARRHPEVITAEYRVAERPPRHVVVDYNQNAWGRTLASVYSVRPTAQATVSAPLDWDEVEPGLRMEAFRIDTMPARIRARGDLWKPLLVGRRYDLAPLLGPAERWLGRGAAARGRTAPGGAGEPSGRKPGRSQRPPRPEGRRPAETPETPAETPAETVVATAIGPTLEGQAASDDSRRTVRSRLSVGKSSSARRLRGQKGAGAPRRDLGAEAASARAPARRGARRRRARRSRNG